MPCAPEIDLRHLRAALARVLDDVEAKFGSTLDLGADHYWTVDRRSAFDPSVDPAKGLTVGQLTDDIEETQRVAMRTDDPIIWHDLAHIVGILTRIAALDTADDAAR
jgi:hypothetical protein